LLSGFRLLRFDVGDKKSRVIDLGACGHLKSQSSFLRHQKNVRKSRHFRIRDLQKFRKCGQPRRVMVLKMKKRKKTPPELAQEWGISADKVLAWINSGELRAIDAATKPGGRPRYLIDEDDIAAFEARRALVPTPKPSGRRRTGKKSENVIDFY
jgi:hypothetical protein